MREYYISNVFIVIFMKIIIKRSNIVVISSAARFWYEGSLLIRYCFLFCEKETPRFVPRNNIKLCDFVSSYVSFLAPDHRRTEDSDSRMFLRQIFVRFLLTDKNLMMQYIHSSKISFKFVIASAYAHSHLCRCDIRLSYIHWLRIYEIYSYNDNSLA